MYHNFLSICLCQIAVFFRERPDVLLIEIHADNRCDLRTEILANPDEIDIIPAFVQRAFNDANPLFVPALAQLSLIHI